MPTPCPSRLKDLIALANLEPDGEARKHLKAVADAFRAKRQGQKGLKAYIQFENLIALNVSLEDGSITSAYTEFAWVLRQIERVDGRVDLVRECPICSEIFWSGRADKEACNRDAVAWRKQTQRRRYKAKAEKRAKERARRKARQIEKPLELSALSPTAIAIGNALMNQIRVFWKIDNDVFFQLNRGGGKPLYRAATVKRTLKMLEEMGYITSHPQGDDPKDTRYAPTQKLRNSWIEARRKAEERWKAKQEAEKEKSTH